MQKLHKRSNILKQGGQIAREQWERENVKRDHNDFDKHLEYCTLPMYNNNTTFNTNLEVSDKNDATCSEVRIQILV